MRTARSAASAGGWTRSRLSRSRRADVAQLVEHFTRNEGVPGSNPGVGFFRGWWIAPMQVGDSQRSRSSCFVAAAGSTSQR